MGRWAWAAGGGGGGPPWPPSKVRRLIILYCDVGLVVNSFLLLKSALIIALNMKPLSHLRWLDCFLLGRHQMASRIPEASKYCAFVINFLLIIDRLLIRRNLDELLIFIYQFVNTHPGKCEPRRLSQQLATGGVPARKRHLMLSERVTNSLGAASGRVSRPNRAPVRPRWEHSFVFGALKTVAVFWFFYALTLIVSVSPMFVTKRGFELLYPNCVSWILAAEVGRQDQANSTPHHSNFYSDFIYERPDPARQAAGLTGKTSVPYMLPLVELTPINLYHLARIASDLFEWYLTELEFIIFSTSHVYFVVRVCLDLMIYISALHAKLRALQVKLALSLRPPQRPAAACEHCAPGSRTTRLVGARGGPTPGLENELLALQARLLDYFHLVRAYNSPVSATNLVCTGTWLFYAFLVFVQYLKSSQLHVELDNGVQFEFLFLFVGALTPVLIIMAAEFVLAARARRMFAQIAHVMALDDANSAAKLHWIGLLSFYHPRSLFCFTMLNTIELSWLSGLKLFSWVISALFIMRTL